MRAGKRAATVAKVAVACAALLVLAGCSSAPVNDVNVLADRVSILQFGVVMALIVLVAQTFVGYRWITRLENEIMRRDAPRRTARRRGPREPIDDRFDDVLEEDDAMAPTPRANMDYMEDVLEVEDEEDYLPYTKRRQGSTARARHAHVVIDDDEETGYE